MANSISDDALYITTIVFQFEPDRRHESLLAPPQGHARRDGEVLVLPVGSVVLARQDVQSVAALDSA
jgi:hypothetical protein